ncbi:hypothetical protein CsatB_011662 [Cannabis sativa]
MNKKILLAISNNIHVHALCNILNLLLIMTICISFLSMLSHLQISIASTYNLVVAVRSSHVAIFFIFNVIFITILFGSFKRFKDCDHVSTLPLKDYHDYHLVAAKADKDYIYGLDDKDYYSDDVYFHGFDDDGYDEDIDEDDKSSDDDDDEDEEWLLGCKEKDGNDDIELQKRSEEFIARTNLRWREELKNERLLLCMVPFTATEILTSSSSS